MSREDGFNSRTLGWLRFIKPNLSIPRQRSSESRGSSTSEGLDESFITLERTPARTDRIRRRRSLGAVFQTVKSKCSRDRLNNSSSESESSGNVRPVLFPKKAIRETLSTPVRIKVSKPPKLDVLGAMGGLPKDGLHRSSTFRASIEKAVDNINDKYGTSSTFPFDKKNARMDEGNGDADGKAAPHFAKGRDDGSWVAVSAGHSSTQSSTDKIMEEITHAVQERRPSLAGKRKTAYPVKPPTGVVWAPDEALCRNDDAWSPVDVRHASFRAKESQRQAISWLDVQPDPAVTASIIIEEESADLTCPDPQQPSTETPAKPANLVREPDEKKAQETSTEAPIAAAEVSEVPKVGNTPENPEVEVAEDPKEKAEDKVEERAGDKAVEKDGEKVGKEEGENVEEEEGKKAEENLIEMPERVESPLPLFDTEGVNTADTATDTLADDTVHQSEAPEVTAETKSTVRSVSLGSADVFLPSVSELVTKFRRMEAYPGQGWHTMPRVRPEDCLEGLRAMRIRGSESPRSCSNRTCSDAQAYIQTELERNVPSVMPSGGMRNCSQTDTIDAVRRDNWHQD